MTAAAPPFALDPRLAAASAPVRVLELCELRLQNDVRWPWLVLIPRRPGLVEIADLPAPERAQLIEEAVIAGEAVHALGQALGRPVQKLNTGALGNIVPQLHLHVLGRCPDDPAWPGPVWGFGEPEPYAPAELERARAALVARLEEGASRRTPTAPA
jgi:diadenosine tetraphosphate (Ap4A) HIT family hydrolase